MTIQTILAQYPIVEKAFKGKLGIKTLTEAYASFSDIPFDDLEGHTRAFFRGYDVFIVVHIVSMQVEEGKYSIVGHAGRISTKNSVNINSNSDSTEVEPYDTAFLSAFDAACKYLEPKL